MAVYEGVGYGALDNGLVDVLGGLDDAVALAAERAGLRWLRRRGFEIIEVNYRARPGEIDLIALERECPPSVMSLGASLD